MSQTHLATHQALQPGVPVGQQPQPGTGAVHHARSLAQQPKLSAHSHPLLIASLLVHHLPGQAERDLLTAGGGGYPGQQPVLWQGGVCQAHHSNVGQGDEGNNVSKQLLGYQKKIVGLVDGLEIFIHYRDQLGGRGTVQHQLGEGPGQHEDVDYFRM